MRKGSILRQLLVNILAPVLVVLIALSVISYSMNRKKMRESHEQLRSQIVSQAKSLLSIHDQALHIIEEDLNQRMKFLSENLVKNYFSQSDSVENANLYRIALELGMDTSTEYIYVIDAKGTITNTTFAKDKGLDFGKMDTSFIRFFKEIREKGNLVIDRFGEELATGKIKKYSYQPLPDKKYIIELGIYSQKAFDLENKVRENIREIRENFPDIKHISSYAAVTNQKNEHLRENHYPHYNKALREKSYVRVSEDSAGVENYFDYIYLEIQEASLYSGYLLVIESDNSRESALIRAELFRFFILFIVTLSILSAVVYFRSRSIAQPIKILTEKAQVIAGGKLDERVPVSGNNEITRLSESFNTMIDDLENMYVNLENKVKDRTRELHQQKELVEEKNKEIMDSINYAKRIQYALLAHDELLQKNLPEHFVLFMPKDVVSGDFYWGTEHLRPDGSVDFYLAVCDSTGHGVPGAFMSLLNISFLNEAINEKGMEEPGKILDHARIRLIENISQQGQKDGMDGILLRIHKGKISLAAAHNGAVLLRKGEIIELPVDKMPVGQGDRMDPFTTLYPEFEKGDLLYLFTDGYADQFGGPKGKKFKYSQLYKLICEIGELPLHEQGLRMKDEIEKWKGDLEQVDDICVIAIRID